jgi:rhodanese-related sulfurtransferase
MPVKQVTPKEANALLKNGSAYVDVRTEREFASGHPEGAVNIPIAFPDSSTGMMRINEEFVSVVQSQFATDTPLVLGCQSGVRSQRAAEVLMQAGFTNVSNMRGGFGGNPETPGWAESGLPICRGCDESHTYSGLKAQLRR